MEEPDWKLIAAQLRRPSGALASEIGLRMNESNAQMNLRLFDLFDPKSGAEVLEIGPGNGKFVRNLFEKCPDIHYTGIDYSPEMIAEAKAENTGFMSNNIDFLNIAVEELQSAETLYDLIFTVNTIYFWEQPQKTLAVIRSLMNPDAHLWIAFRSEKVMKERPFTQFGFELYSLEKAVALLESCDFKTDEIHEFNEEDATVFSDQSQPMGFTLIKASQHS